MEDAKPKACPSPWEEAGESAAEPCVGNGLSLPPLCKARSPRKTEPGPAASVTCERESCWKGKYLQIALPRGLGGGLLLHSPARRGAQRWQGESGDRSPSGMGMLPDTRLSTCGSNPGSHGSGRLPRQDWPLVAALCLSLPLGTSPAKGHRLPRAPRPLCICPRALAANIYPPSCFYCSTLSAPALPTHRLTPSKVCLQLPGRAA